MLEVASLLNLDVLFALHLTIDVTLPVHCHSRWRHLDIVAQTSKFVAIFVLPFRQIVERTIDPDGNLDERLYSVCDFRRRNFVGVAIQLNGKFTLV